MNRETRSPNKRNNGDCDTPKCSIPDKKQKINVSQGSQKHFIFKEERTFNGVSKKFYTCTFCQRELNGTNPGNLQSHLQTHKEVYAKISASNGSIEEQRLRLLMDCVEMVSVNGRSFSHLYDSALHSMLKDKLTELESTGRKLNLVDPHLTEVKECLKRVSNSIRDKIKNEIKNRPLSLMADIVTKRGRSILGFSLQYIFNGKVRVRSIGMMHLEASHTGAYLAELIVKRLKEFGVELYQILTVTTDNGANMLKMIKDIRKVESDMYSSSADKANAAENSIVGEKSVINTPNEM